MLYSIFLYETETGLLIWDQNFDASSVQQVEMFSSFFAAIKNFVKELVLKGRKDSVLEDIQMGDYQIKLVSIKEIGCDLVFIFDEADDKRIQKTVPKLLNLLTKEHGRLFEKAFDGKLQKYRVLNDPVNLLLRKQKGLIGQKSLFENQEEFIKMLFKKRGKLDPQETAALQGEWDNLKKEFDATQLLLKRLSLLDRMIIIEQRLADDEKFLRSSRLRSQVKRELDDMTYKLNFWIKETKDQLSKAIQRISNTTKTITEGDYKDAYRSFLDFSANIKKLIDPSIATGFHKKAMVLIDSKEVDPDVLSETIHEILNMKEDVFEIIRDLEEGEKGEAAT